MLRQQQQKEADLKNLNHKEIETFKHGEAPSALSRAFFGTSVPHRSPSGPAASPVVTPEHRHTPFSACQ